MTDVTESNSQKLEARRRELLAKMDANSAEIRNVRGEIISDAIDGSMIATRTTVAEFLSREQEG
ncbi:hypothetical protein [Rhizobium leguminosarum]|uniref:hypothetical protein n=1 Tax=Rhizobium leguminosarum TaxID=384 RepID=UPI002E0D18D7|nr:hypothetical protein U8Q02_40480 [Rhizobium leguminosarum]